MQARWVGRQWRYTIRWSGAGARVSKNIVMVSSKPRQSVDAVRVSVWTGGAISNNQGASDDIPSGHQLSSPVPVYAQVSVGSSPVLGATVYLDVEVENTNGTVFVLLPSLMLDNGHGEPDITGDDGKDRTFEGRDKGVMPCKDIVRCSQPLQQSPRDRT